jgi:hypothetical protein
MPDGSRNRLVQLVESAIKRHVERRQWEIEQAVEAEERKGLLALLNGRVDRDGER